MRSIRLLLLLTSIELFIMACAADVIPPSQPASTPVDMIPEIIPRISALTQIPSLVPFQQTPETTISPEWVSDFSNPILASLVGRRPDFQDDFSLLNRGWFYDVAGSPVGPYYAHIQDGGLILRLPEGKERSDSMVYNPTLNRRNFVLSFEIRFGETQPNDFMKFHFSPTADQSFSLELSKNKEWMFRWVFNNDWKSISGTYDQFPPERIIVLFIVQDGRCAVYLNHTPLDYSSKCISVPPLKPSPRAVAFHLIADPDHTAIVNIDNVKMWDLDAAPYFPPHP